MNFLALFQTAGSIFGPAIMLSGILALIVCFKASRAPRSVESARRAMRFSLLPFAVSICGALFGLILITVSGIPLATAGGWLAVGQTCLAGFVVTVIPLVWSLLLLRPRRNSSATTA